MCYIILYLTKPYLGKCQYPHLNMKKMRIREIHKPVQSHIEENWQNQTATFLTARPLFFSEYQTVATCVYMWVPQTGRSGWKRTVPTRQGSQPWVRSARLDRVMREESRHSTLEKQRVESGKEGEEEFMDAFLVKTWSINWVASDSQPS